MTIVCLCGSTRFMDVYKSANRAETLKGNIVLSVGVDMRTDDEIANLTDEQKESIKSELDKLHLRKIDLADEVLVLNVGGYIGTSTKREIAYAQSKNKIIRYSESVV